MKQRYIQSEQVIYHYSELPWWRRAGWLDLCYTGYGLLIVLLVLTSYLMVSMNWLPHDPQKMNLSSLLLNPGGGEFLLGTDYMGRDLQSRLIMGIQAYFVPGLLAIAIALVLGSFFGVLAGYYQGWAEKVVNYIGQVIDSFPRLVLILLVVASFKPDIFLIMAIVGITNAPTVAARIRGKIQFLKQCNFIESAIACGLPQWKIILKHILWYNCRTLLIIQATVGMGEAILIETSLSYLGFGVQEPVPSWGNMVQSGANYLLQGSFWPSTLPALAILLTVLGFHLLADGLNNILEGKKQ